MSAEAPCARDRGASNGNTNFFFCEIWFVKWTQSLIALSEACKLAFVHDRRCLRTSCIANSTI